MVRVVGLAGGARCGGGGGGCVYSARLFCRCSSLYQSRSSSPMLLSSCVFEDSKGFGRFFAAQKPGSGLRWSQPPPTARGGCWRKVPQSLHVNRSFRGIAHLVSQSFRGRARPAPYAGGAAVLTLHDCPQPWPGSAAAPAGGNRSGVRRGSAPTTGAGRGAAHHVNRSFRGTAHLVSQSLRDWCPLRPGAPTPRSGWGLSPSLARLTIPNAMRGHALR